MKKAVFFLCVFLLGGMGLSFGSVIYVDMHNTTGTEDGTLASPYNTVQEGINAATYGDTVSVAAGTYYENISLKSGIIVQGAGADVTAIEGVSTSQNSRVVGVFDCNNVIIFGFTFTKARRAGVWIQRSSQVTIANNIIRDIFYVWNTSVGVLLGHSSDVLITNNVFADNNYGIKSDTSFYLTITNNAFTYNNCYAISQLYGSSFTISYNDFWRNAVNLQGCSAGLGNIYNDPLFVDPANHDFHLQMESLCIDAGNNDAVPLWITTDFEGDPRVYDGNDDGVATVDMGADEYKIADAIPPTTLAVASPSPNAAGWNNSDVAMDLSAVDEGGSGVTKIGYSLTGATSVPITIIQGNTAHIIITEEGATSLNYWAVDGAGNEEATKTHLIMIDKAPPTISGSRTPLPNTNGWNNTDVTVHFEASDNGGSGVDSVTPDTILNLEGSNQSVTGTATDLAGNSSICTVMGINIDKTPPVPGAAIASPNSLWPPDHKMIPITIAVTATDNFPDQPVSTIVSVTSNEPINGLGDGDMAPDWEITGNLTVNLRAERSGTGTGRIYTITVQCKDAAGNVMLKDVFVTVPKSKGK